MPLVEGHDLTVRGDTVFLKTLGGLRRVHSILRRLDDDFCDPLELRGDSALGVPGLIGALRAGRVMVSNALGTGVLESAAWLGFLPPIAERLIGEKLLLPEVATWWLGEKPALEYVLANLDRLVIKPTYPNQRFEPMFGRDFEGKARDAADRAPAQSSLRLRRAGTRAAVAGAGVEIRGVRPSSTTRALTIRVYAVVTPDGVRVMPGGLARVAQRSRGRRGVHAARRRRQGHLGAERQSARGNAHRRAVRQVGAAAAPGLHPLAPGRKSLLAGPLHACAARTPRACCCARWPRAATRACGRTRGRSAAISARSRPTARCSTRCARADSQGLQADVKHLAWCASQVRNRLSARYWRGVVGLQRQMQEAAATRGSSREVYERVLLSLAALTGFSEEDMMHDEGWRVMRLGRRIERMQFVANILVRQLRERARHAPRDRGVAARRLRQHAYLPRALPRRAAPLADAEPAAVRRWAPDGAGIPPALHRSRSRRPGALRSAASASAACPTCRCCRRARPSCSTPRARPAMRRAPSSPSELAELVSARRRALRPACRAAISRSSTPTRTRSPHEPPMSRSTASATRPRYAYAADVVHSHHLLHLVPRPAPYQECLEHEIQIDARDHRRVDELDAFGNPLIRIELAQPHRELTVISQMQIEVHTRPAVLAGHHRAVGKGARLVCVSRRVAVARPARCRAFPP